MKKRKRVKNCVVHREKREKGKGLLKLKWKKRTRK